MELPSFILSSEDYLDQLVPFIKSELETNENLDGLISKLEGTTQERQDALEGLAFNSVDDLTQSVDSIRQVVDEAQLLSRDIDQMNRQLQHTGGVYVEQKQKALEAKKLCSKINDTYLAINTCLESLEKDNKVLELIENKQFYKALVNTDDQSIRKMVVEETFNQLIKWLNGFERSLGNLGEVLFDNYNALNEDWARRDESLLPYKVNSPIERTLRSEKYKYFDPLNNSLIQIDLSAIHQSILVFDAVNQLDKLKEDYNNELLRRRDRLLYPIKHDLTPESLKILLYSVAAFLVADRYISNETHHVLRTDKQTTDMYDSILSKLLPHIDDAETLGVFMQILENWGFETTRLYDVMVNLFADHIKLAIKEFHDDYIQLSLSDDSQPVNVSSQGQFDKIMSQCFFKIESDGNFPTTLPYSIVYPGACVKLRHFIRDLYGFMEKYYRKRLDRLSQMVASAVDQVLIEIVLKDLDTKVKSSYKEEVSQNLINLEFFSNSVLEIEKYLNYSSDPVIAKTRSTPIKLKAEQQFKNTRRVAEEEMFKMVDHKVETLFEMVDFDWDTHEVNAEPSVGIRDMGQFLENMFQFDFSHLPYSTRTLLMIRSFDKIVTFLKSSLLEADSVTDESIQNFQTDINYVESLLPNLKVSGGYADEKSNETLQQMFVGLQQMVDLLKEGSLDSYKEKRTRYSSLNPEEAQKLVRKLDTAGVSGSSAAYGDVGTRNHSRSGSNMSATSPPGSPQGQRQASDGSLLSGLKRQATNGFSFSRKYAS